VWPLTEPALERHAGVVGGVTGSAAELLLPPILPRPVRLPSLAVPLVGLLLAATEGVACKAGRRSRSVPCWSPASAAAPSAAAGVNTPTSRSLLPCSEDGAAVAAATVPPPNAIAPAAKATLAVAPEVL